MQTRLNFPYQYQRGEGVLTKLGTFAKDYGKKAMLIGGHKALEAVKEQVSTSLAEAGVELATVEWFGGECTWANVDKMVEVGQANGIDLLIVAGGGRAIDTGKATAFKLQIPCITIATIGATCAAMTPLSIINDDHGRYIENSPNAVTPVGVFVDPAIIAKAPSRWLFAGLGDTLAKMYEYRATTSKVELNSWTMGAINNGYTCYDIIKKFGKGAREAVEAETPNADLGYALDAIVYYAGLCSILGGEKVRGCAAHCVYFGFTNIPEAHELGHGLLVGFGNLCLLALEDRTDEELIEEIKLAIECGVPVKLADICEMDDEKFQIVADVAANAGDMKNMPFDVTAQMVIDAIKRVDRISTTMM